jgi:hypothetical protein
MGVVVWHLDLANSWVVSAREAMFTASPQTS